MTYCTKTYAFIVDYRRDSVVDNPTGKKLGIKTVCHLKALNDRISFFSHVIMTI
jgi:hypothetical protein